MKKIILSILFFSSIILTHAQNTFEHVYIANHNVVDRESCVKNIELANGDYIAMGWNPGCEFCQKLYYIRKYDHFGNLFFDKLINPGSGGDYPDIILTKDGNLLFYFSVGFPTVNLTWDYRLYFYKMDLNGDTLFTKNYYYQRPDQNIIFQIQLNELADSSIIFSCNEIVMKLSQTLDSVKTLFLGNRNYSVNKINMDSVLVIDNNYQVGVTDSLIPVRYSKNLDSLGFLFPDNSGFLNNFSNDWHMSYPKQFNDSNFVTKVEKAISTYDSVAFVMFDSRLNLIWRKNIVIPYLSMVVQDWAVKNNTVTYFGSKLDLTFNGNDSAFFYRFNINTGDSLQFKTFSAKNIYNGTKLRDLKYCSEGYLISGWAKADTTGQESYFAVLDTLGNVTSSISKVETFPMQVYQNPTTDYFSVEIQGEKAYQYILTDATGRILESKKGKGKMNFDLENYSAGNYFLSVTGDQVKRQVIIIKQ